MMNGYNYDALNNTLTISASFAKKTSKVGSPEYCVILKLRRDFPNLTIMKEEKKEGKKGITLPAIGKVKLIKRPARTGRNPATGETIKIKAKTVVKILACKAFKDAVLA